MPKKVLDAEGWIRHKHYPEGTHGSVERYAYKQWQYNVKSAVTKVCL